MTRPQLRSRRQVLGGLGVLAAAAALPTVRAQARTDAPAAPANAANVSSPWLLGLQLYTLEDAPAKDLSGTLKEVAGIGYRTVQISQTYGQSAQQLRSALNQAGLSCPAIHVLPRPALNSWDLEGDLSRLADDIYTLGATYAVVPAPRYSDALVEALNHPPPGGFNPEKLLGVLKLMGADDWKRTADLMNDKAELLARSGIRVGYHNHGFDFVPVENGKSGYDILLERTDPKLVDLELDVGWAVSAGQDVKALFHRANGRIRTLHLKDTARVSGNPMDLASTDVGTGIVNWREVFGLIRETRVRYLFVEQEAPWVNTSPMKAARAAYAYISKQFGHAAFR
jgi:sugar phosphate isomerase/epimerase